MAENRDEVNAKRRAKYHENRDEERARNRKYAAEHKDTIREQRKRYREKYPEKVKAYSLAYYYAHRDEALARQREYNASHKAELAEKERARRERNKALYAELGAQIRLARNAHGYSLRTLAQMAGVSTSLIRKWEMGEAEPSLDKLLAHLPELNNVAKQAGKEKT